MLTITSMRMGRGWSRAELARRANLNPTTIGLIENGRFKPYASQVLKLAKALGVPKNQASTLVTESDEVDQ